MSGPEPASPARECLFFTCVNGVPNFHLLLFIRCQLNKVIHALF
jgi:hypothetical protein